MKATITRLNNDELIEVNITTERGYISITGNLFKRNTGRINQYDEYKKHEGKLYRLFWGGCIHEQIAEAVPELKEYLKLHLSSYPEGTPMYAIENGLYWFKKGDKGAYIRATKEEFEKYGSDFTTLFNEVQKKYRSEVEKFEKVVESLI